MKLSCFLAANISLYLQQDSSLLLCFFLIIKGDIMSNEGVNCLVVKDGVVVDREFDIVIKYDPQRGYRSKIHNMTVKEDGDVQYHEVA
jgi:hypothetical protein